MRTLTKLQNYLPEAIHYPGTSEYPEHVDFLRYRIFDAGHNQVQILITDQSGNPQVLLSEMEIAEALVFIFNSITGRMIDVALDRILQRNKDEYKVKAILSLVQ